MIYDQFHTYDFLWNRCQLKPNCKKTSAIQKVCVVTASSGFKGNIIDSFQILLIFLVNIVYFDTIILHPGWCFPSKPVWKSVVNSTIDEKQASDWNYRINNDSDFSRSRNLHHSIQLALFWKNSKTFTKIILLENLDRNSIFIKQCMYLL